MLGPTCILRVLLLLLLALLLALPLSKALLQPPPVTLQYLSGRRWVAPAVVQLVPAAPGQQLPRVRCQVPQPQQLPALAPAAPRRPTAALRWRPRRLPTAKDPTLTGCRQLMAVPPPRARVRAARHASPTCGGAPAALPPGRGPPAAVVLRQQLQGLLHHMPRALQAGPLIQWEQLQGYRCCCAGCACGLTWAQPLRCSCLLSPDLLLSPLARCPEGRAPWLPNA